MLQINVAKHGFFTRAGLILVKDYECNELNDDKINVAKNSLPGLG